MRNKFCLRLLKLHCAQLLIVGQVLHLRLRRVLPPSLLINRVLHDLDYSKRWIFFGRKRLSISDDLGNHEMTLPFGGSPSRVFTWTTDRISIKNEDVQLFTVTGAMRDGGRTFRPSVKVRAMSLGGRRASVEGVGILGFLTQFRFLLNFDSPIWPCGTCEGVWVDAAYDRQIKTTQIRTLSLYLAH